jgi:hypothetical protein
MAGDSPIAVQAQSAGDAQLLHALGSEELDLTGIE